MPTDLPPAADRFLDRLILFVFVGLLCFHGWAAHVGWLSNNLPGGEFRQAQTAISTYFIKEENNYSLAYPTPVLGPPWSVPMEFPLYQWTVAGWSSLTGLDITRSARMVSLICFYLTLPAIFLLLGHGGVSRLRRLLPLGLILVCPLYIFYARAFLIEMMALMFTLWFLAAFVAVVKKGGIGWLLLANVMGAGAGLVKVTTFMVYLMPAGVWSLWVLYQNRPVAGSWRQLAGCAGRILGATVVPFGATLWWLNFADAQKALNPNAEFLLSGNLNGFNFGYAGARWSPEIWLGLWDVLRRTLVWPPALAICLLALVGGRRWWREAAVCAACFLSAPLLFPQLYAWHDYYAVANGVLLMAAMGFGLLGLWETRWPRWTKVLALVGVLAGQIGLYRGDYYRVQEAISMGGSGLSTALNQLTPPDGVVVMVGEDWNSITPYFARRRALMIPNGKEFDEAYVTRAFRSLTGHKVGALVLPQQPQRAGFDGILPLAQRELGVDPRPVLMWHQLYVYLPAATRDHALANLRQRGFHEAMWVPGSEPIVAPRADEWEWYDRIAPEARANFKLMKPQPVRFKSSYGVGLGSRGDRMWCNAHAETKLRFALPAGPHRLRLEFMMDPGCYDPRLNPADMSDGVNMDIRTVLPTGEETLISSRLFAPATKQEDRGPQVVEQAFSLSQAGEVEILIGPGPHGSPARDWSLLGAIQFD